MKYDDKQHIYNYLERNSFPRIHDNIFSLNKFIDPTNVLDIGSSIGLLSLRLGQYHNNVLGIEHNIKTSIQAKKLATANVKFEQFAINKRNMFDFENLIKRNLIKVVFARRVLPEIYDVGGLDLLQELIQTLYECDVHTIVIEGRQRRKNAKHPLNTVEKETALFEGYYKLKHEYKECVLLEKI